MTEKLELDDCEFLHLFMTTVAWVQFSDSLK